ncbi:MAG: LysR family transcriptional regulator [Protaetiibacter sp.]
MLHHRISLHRLEVFCEVVEAGGVGRAATSLSLSQPVVSAHVRALEDRLEVRLAEKDGRGIRLTEAGRVVYGWARRVRSATAEMERTLSLVAAGQAGSLTVFADATVGSYTLPGVVAAFLERYRDADVTLEVRQSDLVLAGVADGLADCGVVLTDAVPEGSGLRSVLLGSVESAIVTSPRSTAAAIRMTVSEAAEEEWVTPPPGSTRRRIEDAVMAGNGLLARRSRMSVGNPEAQRRAVLSGAGIAVMPLGAVERELANGTLQRVEVAGFAPLKLPMFLIHREGAEDEPSIQAFIEFVADATAD